MNALRILGEKSNEIINSGARRAKLHNYTK